MHIGDNWSVVDIAPPRVVNGLMYGMTAVLVVGVIAGLIVGLLVANMLALNVVLVVIACIVGAAGCGLFLTWAYVNLMELVVGGIYRRRQNQS